MSNRFFGSGAVLLQRPHHPGIKTVNDKDALLANFWRAIEADPTAVAHYADWPVNEVDLHARHQWLVDQRTDVERLIVDPEWYDPKMLAGGCGASRSGLVVDGVPIEERAPSRRALSRHTRLVVDATGVGRPVVDLLRAARLDPLPVVITGGDTESHEDGFWRVPKRDLVSRLQVVLQAKRITFAEGMRDVQILVQELLNFQVKITTNAHDTYGAWREGTHDDYVLAVAIAVWAGERFAHSGTRQYNYLYGRSER
jgi:hypothetical protein